MRLRQWRYWGTCASALVMAAALTMPAASSERKQSSAEPAQASVPAPHHGATTARHKHATKAAPRKETTRHEHKKDVAAKPPPSHPPAPADKSSERRSVFGPLSLGVETSPNVKRRSLAGGEADPDRDFLAGPPPRQTMMPSFFGLSLKSEFSW